MSYKMFLNIYEAMYYSTGSYIPTIPVNCITNILPIFIHWCGCSSHNSNPYLNHINCKHDDKV